jgi:hypothetical protein
MRYTSLNPFSIDEMRFVEVSRLIADVSHSSEASKTAKPKSKVRKGNEWMYELFPNEQLIDLTGQRRGLM